MRPGRVHFFFFPRGYFFVPSDDVVVLFAENSKLESLKNSTIISLCLDRLLGDF